MLVKILVAAFAFSGVSASGYGNCTNSQVKKVINKWTSMQKCAGNKYCIDWEEDNDNGRRRLEDNGEKTAYQTYRCYTKYCASKMTDLQAMCNACDTLNYVYCPDDDNNNNNDNNGDDEEECQQEDGEMSFYQTYCMIDSRVVMSHADSFINMMLNANNGCLKEIEYMVNPPEEENNNNRRRLEDNGDDEQPTVEPEQIAACWAAPFPGPMGQPQSYQNLEYCNYVCNVYGNTTYSYHDDYTDEPTQTCGLHIGYYDNLATANEFLPYAITHESLMCVPSVCSNDDMGYISDYLVKMAGYSAVVNFCGEEGGDNCGEQQNNGGDENNMYIQSHINIPETMGSWKCDEEAAGGEGAIENENFPDMCGSNTPSPKDDTSGDSSYATAAIFAIICGLGMGVFMILFIYYYRQTIAMRTGQEQKGLMGSTGTSQPASYQA